MKHSLVMLPVITCLFASSQAAVISLDVGVSALTSAERTFDIDDDGVTDFSFRGNGGICTDDVPTSTCVFAVTIHGGSGIEFLLDPALGGPARPLVAGDRLGPASAGAWASTPFDALSVASVAHLLDPNPANSGYPGYLDGFDVYSMGFRQFSGGAEPRYGWIDVALFLSATGGNDSTSAALGIPRVLGIHFSDTPGQTVEFRPVPEPSPSVLAALACVIVLARRNRRNPGEGW